MEEGEESSQLFIDNLYNPSSKGNEARLRPWFRGGLVVHSLILGVHRALAGSGSLATFQILGVGNLLKDFLKDYKYPLPEYLKVLEILVQRLLKILHNEEEGCPPEDVQEVKGFLDNLWELHVNGTLDLTSTSIPSSLSVTSLSRLEGIMVNSTTNTNTLVSLCEKPENFLKISEMLLKKESGPLQVPLSLSSFQFQEELRRRFGSRKFTSLFPTPFHPLLHFLFALSPPSLIKNPLILEELFNLVDKLIYQCEKWDYHGERSLIAFLLYGIPIPGGGGCMKDILLKPRRTHSPWLWVKTLIVSENRGFA